MNAAFLERPRANRAFVAFALVYVALVLTVDALATKGVQRPIDWSLFVWRWDNGFDLFKFLFWLVIPMAISLRYTDWARFSVLRWQRVDWIVLAVIALAGLAAMAVIPASDALRGIYPDLGALSPREKLEQFLFGRFTRGYYGLLWYIAWLPGWEIMHRHFLLVPIEKLRTRGAWLLIPVIEAAYHLQKPWPETAGMFILGVVLTAWSMKRNNVLLPIAAHLLIEIELVAFMVF